MECEEQNQQPKEETVHGDPPVQDPIGKRAERNVGLCWFARVYHPAAPLKIAFSSGCRFRVKPRV
jgi:hypothetical protein